MNIKQKFGIKIKNLRKSKGLSQEKLANLAEIDRTYLPTIEKGERNVSIEVIERLASLSAFNRLGEPEDIAQTVAFLASDDAKWITAQNIGVNGGMA